MATESGLWRLLSEAGTRQAAQRNTQKIIALARPFQSGIGTQSTSASKHIASNTSDAGPFMFVSLNEDLCLISPQDRSSKLGPGSHLRTNSVLSPQSTALSSSVSSTSLRTLTHQSSTTKRRVMPGGRKTKNAQGDVGMKVHSYRRTEVDPESSHNQKLKQCEEKILQLHQLLDSKDRQIAHMQRDMCALRQECQQLKKALEIRCPSNLNSRSLSHPKELRGCSTTTSTRPSGGHFRRNSGGNINAHWPTTVIRLSLTKGRKTSCRRVNLKVPNYGCKGPQNRRYNSPLAGGLELRSIQLSPRGDPSTHLSHEGLGAEGSCTSPRAGQVPPSSASQYLSYSPKTKPRIDGFAGQLRALKEKTEERLLAAQQVILKLQAAIARSHREAQ